MRSVKTPKVKRPNHLVLVAHPDDEFIFAHNLITQNPEVKWTIACATYSALTQRGREFSQSCKKLGAQPFYFGFEDDPYTPLKFDFKVLRRFLAPFDTIVTHNPVGEYGHRHHIDCFQAVKKCRRAGTVVYVFAHNYSLPDFIVVDQMKRQSPIRKIYEREEYIIRHFDLITEGFVRVM
jgi:LmbE family N-acetylglucosaminyl deacetylase